MIQTHVPPQPGTDQQHEMNRIGAVHVLAQRRMTHKTLRRAEAGARLDLAAAILALDEIDARIEAGEKLHSLNEQAAVERAKDRYAQTLADLLRGEAD